MFLLLLTLWLSFQISQAERQWYQQNWGYDSRNSGSTSCGKGRDMYSTNTACGPASWSNAGHPTCKQTSKSQQSPVDISHAIVDDALLTPLFTTLHGGCFTWTQFNSLDDINIDLTQPDALCTNLQMEYEGFTWVMQELRFKSPSEHSIAGGHYDAEGQMIHVNPRNGHAAIVSVLMNVHDQFTPTNNSFLDAIWKSGPNFAAPSQTTVMPDSRTSDFSPYTDFLPGSRNHFQYVGSLTEPPCTEGVHWFIFKDVVSISSDDLKMIRQSASTQPTYLSATGDNSRPLQSGYASVQPTLPVRYKDGTSVYNLNPAPGASLTALVSATNLAVAALVLAILALLITCWSNYLLLNARGLGKQGHAVKGKRDSNHAFTENLPPDSPVKAPKHKAARERPERKARVPVPPAAPAPTFTAAPAPPQAPVLEKRVAKKKRASGAADADVVTTTNPMYRGVVVTDQLDEVL